MKLEDNGAFGCSKVVFNGHYNNSHNISFALEHIVI